MENVHPCTPVHPYTVQVVLYDLAQVPSGGHNQILRKIPSLTEIEV